MKKTIRPWLSFLGAFLILFTSIGLLNTGMALFYAPVTAELNFSQASFSFYHTIALLVYTISAPFFGRYYSRHLEKMRLVFALSGICLMLTFFLYSCAQTLIQFYLLSLVRGLIMGATCSTAASMLINNWFIKRRSLFMSLAFIGSSVGGILYTQICNAVMKATGWRMAYLLLGAIGALTFMIVAIIAIPAPEMTNSLPYGFDPKEPISVQQERKTGLTFSEALRSPAFWLLGLGLFFVGFPGGGVIQVSPSALQKDLGHSASFAANISSIYLCFMCVGKPILGAIMEKFSVRVGILYTNLLILGSAICMYINSTSVFPAYLFAIFFGLGNMLGTTGLVALTTYAFGLKDYGTIHPTLNVFYTLSMSISPTLAGLVYDKTGHYHLYWLMLIGVCLLVIVLLQLGFSLSRRKGAVAADSDAKCDQLEG